jgi:hypothetical protein
MAELIASSVEFDQAFQLAQGDETEILRSGRSSRSVLDQIGAAVLARQILARRMTMDELRRYVQHLQGRYEAAAGPTGFEKYRANVPANVFDDEGKLRAELQTLSYRLRLAYAAAFRRDDALQRIRRFCFRSLVCCLIAVLGAEIWQSFYRSPPFLNYTIVAVVGFGGAVTSIARRAGQSLDKAPQSEDPVFQLSALDGAGSSLMIAALTGPIFALILLTAFMTKTFQLGQMTPAFITTTSPASGMDFTVFDQTIQLASAVEAAKLVVWSFIAGFAEQFVPDVLDRFSSVNRQK